MNLPAKMKAVEISSPGGPDVLKLTERPVPRPAKGEVLIKVAAAGVNGPDIMQRKGLYPAPPGASDLPGLEVSGEIVALGEGVKRWSTGDNVTALMYQIVNFIPPAPSVVNATVPELLDYIVAKMLTKSLEERYQGAQELAQALRECERQLAAPPGSTIPPRPTGLASGPQPELVDTRAHDVVMAQTLNRTRDKDKTPEDPTTPPARGLSHSFDSLEATQRLAVLTGAAGLPGANTLPGSTVEPQTATQAIGSLPPPPRIGWRRRDWLLVGGAAVLGLIVARAVMKRDDR